MHVRVFLTTALAMAASACGSAAAPGSGTVAIAGGESGGTRAPVTVAAHPVAVELFTSQGCSSCPPADVVLGKLARQNDVVAITRPVTYWDQLGWKDTLATPANTNLQRAYRNRGFPGAGVYTPQSVIQGQTGFVGSSEAKIRGEIVRLSRTPEPALTITPRADGGRSVVLDGTASDAVVSVVALRKSVTVQVGRGENGGRALTFYNVLLRETPVGRWRGGNAAFTVPAATVRPRDSDRYALIVREGSDGQILAARYL
ncbi:MAG: DUF1223 domain-containing protein [Pseudomonadota bacterium]